MTQGFRVRYRSNDGSVQGEDVVTQLPIRLGRNERNHCRIVDRFVSDFHAQFERVEGKLCVRDLHSRNGVYSLSGGRVGIGAPFELDPPDHAFVLGHLVQVQVEVLDQGRDRADQRPPRSVGAVLVAGAKPADVIRQYMARGDSPTRGRELNIHFGHPAKDGFIGQISMLGDMIPVMAGIALAGRMQKTNLVALGFIGDGGSSTGAFWEGMNFATVQKLPLVVIVEDNGYAYSTPTIKQSAVKTLADKALGVGCFGETVDGNDVLAVYCAARRAVDRARRGDGVTLLEVKTVRMKGHAEHDNAAYVPPELVAEWHAKDPLPRFERVLLEMGFAKKEDFDAIQARVKKEVDDATDVAERSPMPRPEDAARGLFKGDGYWD